MQLCQLVVLLGEMYTWSQVQRGDHHQIIEWGYTHIRETKVFLYDTATREGGWSELTVILTLAQRKAAKTLQETIGLVRILFSGESEKGRK